MEFINKSKKSVEVRVGERFNYSWVNVKPGETINLQKDKGKRYGFEEVTNNIPKVTEGKIGKVKVETKQISVPEKVVQNDFSKIKVQEFEKELTNIKGIGVKTAWDITKVFPTEEKLREAISHDDELPFRDDIEKKLRKKYGN